MTPRVLKNFNLFVNGRGQAGVIEELELPDIAIKTDGYRGGGMDAETKLDMGMEAMTAKYKFCDPDPDNMRLVGLVSGNSARVIAKGSFVRDSDNTRVAVTVEMSGRFSKLGMGTWKSGDKGGFDYDHELDYYRLNVGGVDVYEIDVLNMKRIVGGVDQLAGIRDDIGL